MNPFVSLLRHNRNYRNTWIGQVVSEIGDHFNNIAVFGLVLAHTGSGMVVAGVMLSRAIPAMLAGPVAGVVLDRMDRKRVMIASDLIRPVVAAILKLSAAAHNQTALGSFESGGGSSPPVGDGRFRAWSQRWSPEP